MKGRDSLFCQNLPYTQPKEALKVVSALEQVGKDRDQLWRNHPEVTSWVPAFDETRTGMEENHDIINVLWKTYGDVNEIKTDVLDGDHIHCQLQLVLVHIDLPIPPLLEELCLPSIPNPCKFCKKKLSWNKKKMVSATHSKADLKDRLFNLTVIYPCSTALENKTKTTCS